MKKIYALLSAGMLAFAVSAAHGQVKVGDNPTTINANSALEIESTNKGFLLPRVALVAPTNPAPLASHVTGMQVYNTATTADLLPGVYFNDGTQWVRTSSDGTKGLTQGSGAPTGTCPTPGEMYTDTLSSSATNGTVWICSAGSWIVYNNTTAQTPFALGKGTVDAGGNKSTWISRQGGVIISPPNFTGNHGHGNASTNGIQLSHWGANIVRLDVQSTGSPNMHLTKRTATVGDRFINFLVNDSNIGSIRVASSTSTVTFANSSDRRLKENILSTSYSINDVMKIGVKDYNYINDAKKTRITGFIAQDLYKVYPDAVIEGGADPNEDPWQVDKTALIPLLVKAIQDQQEEIESLKSTLNERLAQLERNSNKKKDRLSKRLEKKKADHKLALK